MPTNEVAIPAPVGMVNQYAPTLGKILPAHLSVDTFVRLAHGALRRSPELMHAATNNPQSFLSAVMDAARLGHEPGTQHYYLTVRGKGHNAQVVGIEGYQGIVDRMYRAGGVTVVRGNVVRANDRFQWDGHSVPHHDADWFASEADRGGLVGVYMYALAPSGENYRPVVMGRDEVMRHRAAAATTMVWDAWETSMWLKTAARELEKWTPATAEYRASMLAGRAEVAAAGVPEPIPAVVYAEDSNPSEGVSEGPPVLDVSAGDEWPEVARPGSGGRDG